MVDLAGATLADSGNALFVLAQRGSGGGGGIAGAVFGLVYLALIVATFAGLWKIFVKAGHPGWAGIVPIYNLYIMTKIVGRPWWWMLLMLIPLVGLVVWVVLSIDLGKSFGKSVGYGVGLALLTFVFAPLLGFGPDQYKGPSATK